MKRFFCFAIILPVFAGCRADIWTATLERYASDDTVGELLFVKYLGPDATAGSGDCASPAASLAIVEFYVKADCRSDAAPVVCPWHLEFRDTAFVGRNGIGKTREGDGRTPEGEFGIRRAFGILPDPGAQIEYLHVSESTYACDEDSPYYNTIIDTSAVHHACRGEHMICESPSYDYGLETDYNPGNIYPLGSAIFVHCKGDKPSTAGCIALSHDTMRRLVTLARPNLLICVHPR